MKIKIRSSSQKAIIKALDEMIKSFPTANKEHNDSRPFRIALKELKRNK